MENVNNTTTFNEGTFENFKVVTSIIEKDMDKVRRKNNKAAIRRARKSLQQIKQYAHQIRKELTEYANSLPVKTKTA
jgi:hypothetical protein